MSSILFTLHATKAGNLNLKVQGQGQINKKCQVKSKHEGIFRLKKRSTLEI